MSIDRKLLRLYAVTDRSWLRGRALCEDVRKALEGGVTLLQLREKDACFNDFVKSAVQIKKICEEYNVPLIINDNVSVAAAAGADGVHLGQNDMRVSAARKMLGENKIIGVTAKTASQAREAEALGADYLGSGAIFGTSTKSGAQRMDMETLKSITASVSIPVAAIGGITPENILSLKGSGVAGVAVISGIFAAEDIKKAAEDLYAKAGKII